MDATIPIEEVRAGDHAVVKPGERISVDGVVAEGQSAVNQAPITGESVPVDKVAGDQVFAGSVNGEGVLVVEVSAAIGDRTLDRVIKLVSEAETQKAPTQQFTERFERVFVPIVLVADVLLIVVAAVLRHLELVDFVLPSNGTTCRGVAVRARAWHARHRARRNRAGGA